MNRKDLGQEAGLAVKFALVGLVGLAVDATVLKAGFALDAQPAMARAVSLVCAMQVTFLINGLLIFKCLKRTTCLRHWLGYMLTNGFGNLCNYLIFITLVSLHGSWVSHPWVALPISAACAYVINFAGARLIVFGRDLHDRVRGPQGVT